MNEETDKVAIGAVVDRSLVDRLDAIATMHLRSRAKEILLAIQMYVERKEKEEKHDDGK